MKKALFFASVLLVGMTLHRFRGRPADFQARDFVSGIPSVQPDLRLVVARLDFVKESQAENAKLSWGIDWGTTKASLSVPVRAHYAVDLSGPEPVVFEARGAALSAVFPDPKVQAVELLTGQKRVLIQPGWGRLEALSGQALVDALERGLYDRVRADASAPRLLDEVRDKARPQLERLVSDYAARLGRKVEVRVRFVSEEPGAVLQARRETYPRRRG